MKPLLIVLALVLTARAEDCALVTLKIGKEKQLQQFALEFHEGDAPVTVANFKKLAKKGFYNGTAIHRSFAHTLLQMGDPLSEKKDRTKIGTGGPGYTLQPEIRRKHTAGAVAAARLPDKLNPSRVSSGSQFFVCLSPMPAYDGQYTVFAKVLWGLEALDALSTRATDSNDFPAERVVIRSIKIMDRANLPPPPAPPGEGGAKPERKWWQFFG
ncbi:MAG: peptidylprolyl isomerase [Chthoniobacteraceae bacterium]